MAGILNNKTRILDTYITDEGRRQLSKGTFEAKYYSFTDANSIYINDTIISSSNDSRCLTETDRFCFEACSLPQDQITFEADDSGKLINVKNSSLDILAGQIFSGSVIISSSDFSSTSNTLLSSSLDSFKKLRILSSPNVFDINHNDFNIGSKNINFIITNNKPINENEIQKLSINQAESLFMDKKMSHVPNFKFLPPVNKPMFGQQPQPLGRFQNLNQDSIIDYKDLSAELEYYEKNGFQEIVNFNETSPQNNIFAQFFEISDNSIVKLDVIDFGQFTVVEDLQYPTKHVYFAGKVFVDSNGATTFINMFTLIFE